MIVLQKYQEFFNPNKDKTKKKQKNHILFLQDMIFFIFAEIFKLKHHHKENYIFSIKKTQTPFHLNKSSKVISLCIIPE
jgi:hypothetical protein